MSETIYDTAEYQALNWAVEYHKQVNIPGDNTTDRLIETANKFRDFLNNTPRSNTTQQS